MTDGLVENALIDSVENRTNFLKVHNKTADKTLETEIKNSNFSYSKVYGGYRGTNAVNDSYEPSFVVYSKNKRGENIDFAILFRFAVKLCKEFYNCCVKKNQLSLELISSSKRRVHTAPGEKPYYVDKNGRPISHPGKNDTKYNRHEEELFTTSKCKKNNAQRFTADIEFESFRVQRLSNFETRQKQYGEIVLE